MSVLVNESPSAEFSLQRGLRQWDPLALLLFNIVAEGLNKLMREVVEKRLQIEVANESLVCKLNKAFHGLKQAQGSGLAG